MTVPVPAATIDDPDPCSHGPRTEPLHAHNENASRSQDAFDPDVWTLDPAAIPDDLLLDARELLADEHLTFLLQCLVPEIRSRRT